MQLLGQASIGFLDLGLARAALDRFIEHHLVELAAHHLPRLRALVRLVVPEVERRRELAARVHELHAVLLDEAAGPHLRQHAEAVEHLPSIIRIAVGVDELAAGQPGQRRHETIVPSNSIEGNIVDVGHEMLRIHIVMFHQPR